MARLRPGYEDSLVRPSGTAEFRQTGPHSARASGPGETRACLIVSDSFKAPVVRCAFAVDADSSSKRAASRLVDAGHADLAGVWPVRSEAPFVAGHRLDVAAARPSEAEPRNSSGIYRDQNRGPLLCASAVDTASLPPATTQISDYNEPQDHARTTLGDCVTRPSPGSAVPRERRLCDVLGAANLRDPVRQHTGWCPDTLCPPPRRGDHWHYWDR